MVPGAIEGALEVRQFLGDLVQLAGQLLGLLLLLAELLAQVAAVFGDRFDGLADLAELGLGAGFLALERSLTLVNSAAPTEGFSSYSSNSRVPSSAAR